MKGHTSEIRQIFDAYVQSGASREAAIEELAARYGASVVRAALILSLARER